MHTDFSMLDPDLTSRKVRSDFLNRQDSWKWHEQDLWVTRIIQPDPLLIPHAQIAVHMFQVISCSFRRWVISMNSWWVERYIILGTQYCRDLHEFLKAQLYAMVRLMCDHPVGISLNLLILTRVRLLLNKLHIKFFCDAKRQDGKLVLVGGFGWNKIMSCLEFLA